ncbi:hypothetical protein HGP14_29035 [Rhizobium sp. P32RR-XVIII]|uniref:hypothetical protein n=1 Tax=Rhizobium sp. P32RR-XVIII TaxID=2726738 RepID=UPI001456510F|nr:hypothetical protein [Rhizobium sp. P32RR-XVIII]NLS07331.1 hypothetical protein [Rhizobium sp. P32RR-XVIII]
MSSTYRPIADEVPHQDFDRIQRQIVHRAKRLAVTARVLARSRGRSGGYHGRSHRAVLMDHANRLAFERRAELDAMMEGGSREEAGCPIRLIVR